MKKCSIYLDALEKELTRDAWQDVLMHASRCPDCAADMKMHGEIRELLASVPEPEFPAHLHSTIMSGIADLANGNEHANEPGWFTRAFDRLLQPVELAVSLACLVMFVFLMQLDHSPQIRVVAKRPSLRSSGQLAARPQTLPAVAASQTLDAVSHAEVDQFLQQLAEFNHAHRQQQQPSIDYTPELRLVNDLSNRR